MRKIMWMLLRISGLPFLIREIIQKNKVTILLFHKIEQKSAKKAFSYLIKKYNIIDLNDFIDAIEKKDKNKIPKKALILTFDDGHIKNYELLPIIKKYNLPITIFLCALIINTNRSFWFEFINNSLSIKKLKRVSNKVRLDTLYKYGFKQDKEFEIQQALQKKQISEMQSIINMQSHTLFHPILPMCDDLESKKEIFESKEVLEKEYGLDINTISYPNGDYSEREILYAKAAGYKCGITVDFGFNTINSDPFRLKRISVNDTDDINELIVKVSGLWAFFKTINGLKQGHGFMRI